MQFYFSFSSEETVKFHYLINQGTEAEANKKRDRNTVVVFLFLSKNQALNTKYKKG